MKFTLYTAGCTGDRKNCLYPDRAEIRSASDLAAAAAFDHVCAEYAGATMTCKKKSRRKNSRAMAKKATITTNARFDPRDT